MDKQGWKHGILVKIKGIPLAKETSLITNFCSGEFSPLLLGRCDIETYKNGAQIIENFLIHNAGGLIRRPGTKFVSEVKNSAQIVRLIDFQFNTQQSYILEMGEYYFRFYTDQGQVQNTTHTITGASKAATCVITSPNHPFQNGDIVVITDVVGMTELNGNSYTVANRTINTYQLSGINSTGYAAYVSGGIATRSGPLEIATLYEEDELFDVKYAQSADVMYLVHPAHKPMKLQRLSATSWTVTEVEFICGPFLDDNITDITLTPSGTTGNITIVASADFFQAGHDESLFKIHGEVDSVQGYVKITKVIDAQHVEATVMSTLSDTAATTDWAEGAWSDFQGFPGSVTFHEQRLIFGGGEGTQNPQTVWASVSQSFEDMTAGAEDSDAYIYIIGTEQVNAIRWLSSGHDGLRIGTSGGTFTLSSGAGNTPITPSSVVVQRDTTYGAAKIIPKRIGNFVYFIQRNLKILRELGYDYDTDSQKALDMTILSDHILGDGIVDMAYQQSPNDILWCVRTDGLMATLTRQIDQRVIAWSRQITGRDPTGVYHATFKSVAVVPIEEGDDEVWVIVRRYINGAYVQYIEFFMPREFAYDHEMFFVDSGLTLNSPIIMYGATAANPVVITATSHGLSNGDQIKITQVYGMTELNNNFYLVANKTDHTFELTTLTGENIDGTGFSPYFNGGEIRKMVTLISGLTHLIGAEVDIFADGGARPRQIVSATGTITLTSKAAVVHIGLPYTPKIKGLPLVNSSATGFNIGQVRRAHKALIRLYKTLGGEFGTEDEYFPIPHESTIPLGSSPSLFTGIKEIDCSLGWDRLGEFYIIQSQPLPINILYVELFSDVSTE